MAWEAAPAGRGWASARWWRPRGAPPSPSTDQTTRTTTWRLLATGRVCRICRSNVRANRFGLSIWTQVKRERRNPRSLGIQTVPLENGKVMAGAQSGAQSGEPRNGWQYY
jgi:hypothetical protein